MAPATSTARTDSSGSGAYRRDKPAVLLWLCTGLLGVVTAVGVHLWTRQVAQADEHEKRLGAMERDHAADRIRVEALTRSLEEVRLDLKELLRRTAAK